MPRQNDPFLNTKFRVEIDGISIHEFSEVIMPQARADVVEWRTGSEPSRTRKLPGLISYSNLVLRHGLTGSNELFEYWKEVVDGTLSRRGIVVSLLDETGQTVVWRWSFLETWPCRYELSRLDANGGEPVTETVEIAYESFVAESQ